MKKIKYFFFKKKIISINFLYNFFFNLKKKKINKKKIYFIIKLKNNIKKLFYFNNLYLKFYNYYTAIKSFIKKKIIIIYYIKYINKKKIYKKIIQNFIKLIFNFYIYNKKFIFKKKKNNFIKKFNYYIYCLKKINYKIRLEIIKKNVKYFLNIIKKYKNKNYYNDIYQEIYILYKKIIFTYNFKEKNLIFFLYWKIKKKINLIILKKKNENLSLEKPIFNKELKDSIESDQNLFLKNYDKVELINIIRNIIKEFPLREQKIIRLRFGIGYKKISTLEEIGLMCDLTKERIRQIELKIILKIRLEQRSEVLKQYIKILNKQN